MPLAGASLRDDTELRLVVADNPPFVLDVDSRSVTRLRGFQATGSAPVVVVGVGGEGAVASVHATKATKHYAVRGAGRRVSYLGSGRHVWPSSDGGSVWIQARAGRSWCALRQVDLDARVIRAPQPFPCASLTAPTVGSLGLVVNPRHVLDPWTGDTVIETPMDIVAVANEKLVLADRAGQTLAVLDTATGSQLLLEWPSILWGLDAPAVDPSGRYVALAFAAPAWSGSRQVLDIWLLDTETGEVAQLPGMPAFVSLKRTSMVWTNDGRLVLLAQESGKDMIAVWQAGQARLRVKTVRLPDRSDAGSDSFAVIR